MNYTSATLSLTLQIILSLSKLTTQFTCRQAEEVDFVGRLRVKQYNKKDNQIGNFV